MSVKSSFIDEKIMALKDESPLEIVTRKTNALMYLTHVAITVNDEPIMLMGPGDCELSKKEAKALVELESFTNIINAMRPDANISVKVIDGLELEGLKAEVPVLSSKAAMSVMFEGDLMIYGVSNHMPFIFQLLASCSDIVNVFTKIKYEASITLEFSDEMDISVVENGNTLLYQLSGVDVKERVLLN